MASSPGARVRAISDGPQRLPLSCWSQTLNDVRTIKPSLRLHPLPQKDERIPRCPAHGTWHCSWQARLLASLHTRYSLKSQSAASESAVDKHHSPVYTLVGFSIVSFRRTPVSMKATASTNSATAAHSKPAATLIPSAGLDHSDVPTSA